MQITSPSKEIDWEKERAEFPAVENQTYFLSAATGPISRTVYQAYLAHLENLHRYGDINWQENVDLLGRVREGMRRYYSAESADDIGFSPNTSHGMNLIAMILKQRHPEGGVVLMPEDEFPSSSIAWYHHGFEVKRVRTDLLFESVKETRSLVAVVTSAIQFSTGYRQNLIRLGKVLDERDIPFIVNGTQAIGAFPISVKEAKISALTASCHKWLCSGYGVSALYTSPSFREGIKWPLVGWLSVEDPWEMSASAPRVRRDTSAVETGVHSVAIFFGIEAALNTVFRIGGERIAERIFNLSNELVKKLKERGIPSLEILSPRDDQGDFRDSVNSGIVMLQVPNVDEVVKKLVAQKIFTTVRKGKIRVAVHYFNNQADLDRLINVLEKALLEA